MDDEAYIEIRDVVADFRDEGFAFDEIRRKLFLMINKAILDVKDDEKDEDKI